MEEEPLLINETNHSFERVKDLEQQEATFKSGFKEQLRFLMWKNFLIKVEETKRTKKIGFLVKIWLISFGKEKEQGNDDCGTPFSTLFWNDFVGGKIIEQHSSSKCSGELSHLCHPTRTELFLLYLPHSLQSPQPPNIQLYGRLCW